MTTTITQIINKEELYRIMTKISARAICDTCYNGLHNGFSGQLANSGFLMINVAIGMQWMLMNTVLLLCA